MNSEIFKKPLPYVALLLAHLIWGANHVVAKIALQEFPPMSLAFLRFGLACLLIVPFLATVESKSKKIKLEHLPRIVGVAILMITLNIAFFYQGLAKTTAINASVIELSIPIISLLAGWVFLKEKVFIINLVGLFLGILGSLIILGLPVLFIAPANTAFVGNVSEVGLLGNFLVLLSSVSFVAGAMLSRKILKNYPPLVLTSSLFLIGALTFFIPAVLEYIHNPSWIYQVTLYGVLGLLYIVIMSSICAYFLMVWALAKISISHANLFQYIEPIIAASLAVPILGERVSFSFIIATCLIGLGVYWATLGKQEHHHLHHRHHRN